ncbi:MAG TPA: biotin/lipoyl-containing protein [Variovorax sp.]
MLIDALAASDLSELEYIENGCTLRLVKSSALREAATPRQVPAPTRAQAPGLGAPTKIGSVALVAPRAECLAPLYGVVHLHPSPGEPAFVAPGQRVTCGQTLCVIEAMKVFNEVRADADALVQSVLVQSGEEVEAGQPLFVFG